MSPAQPEAVDPTTSEPYPGPLRIPRPEPVAFEEVILLQAFGWQSCQQPGYYDTVRSQVSAIAAAGFSHVWLPPPSKSVSPQGYLPNQLYDLDSRYGSFEALVALNSALLEAGVRPLADIVINHRCADAQDQDGVWNIFYDNVPHPGRSLAWEAWAIANNDPTYHGRGRADSGEDYGPAPDLDHRNLELRAGLADWLRWLRSHVGFEGWRFDFAKGYAPEFAAWYVEESLRAGVDFCVAEYWVDAAWEGSNLSRDQNYMRQELCDYCNATGGYIAVFDFTTKAVLQEAIRHDQYDRLKDSSGKPPGVIGRWPERAVPFVDNHDTGSSQQHWPFPVAKDGIMQGYAYILTHPGIPCVFWEHWIEPKLQQGINRLLRARCDAGLRADSKIEILAANPDLYVARVNDALVCKLGPRFDMGPLLPKASEGWKMVASGENWAVWERAKPSEGPQ